MNIVTTGDISSKYQTIGLVGTTVDNKDVASPDPQAGCNGCGDVGPVRIYVSVSETYNRGAQALLSLANQKGGNCVINARFEHRIAVELLDNPAGQLAKAFGSKTASSTTTNQVVELFCYGTAVRVFEDIP